MNNVELAKKVEGYLKKSAAKAKKFEDLVAVSFSLLSENDEDIYVAVRDGKLGVAPYAYNDNNCAVEASAEVIDKMFSGALSFDEALANGSVQIKSGDPAKLKALECLVPSKKAAKADKDTKPVTKARGKAADKTAPAKTEEKKTVPAAKATEKSSPAAKTVEKKTAAAAKTAEKKTAPAAKVEEKKAAPAVKAVEKKAAPVAKSADKKTAAPKATGRGRKKK